MSVLKEMARVIGKNQTRDVHILSREDRDTKMYQVYSLLLEPGVSEAEAFREVYQESDSSTTVNKARHLLLEKLTNTLFLIDGNKSRYGNYADAYAECNKNLAAANILFRKGSFRAAAYLCEKILRHAQKFEFTELEIMALRKLRLQYTMREPSAEKFRKLNLRYLELIRVREQEETAESFVSQIYLHYQAVKTDFSRIAELATAFERELDALEVNEPTSLYLYHANFVRLTQRMTAFRYADALTVCREAISQLRERPLSNRIYRLIFSQNMLACAIQLENYDLATDIHAEIEEEFIQPGNSLWFQHLELGTKLAIHRKNYPEAVRLFLLANKSPQLARMSVLLRERWTLLRMHLMLLHQVGWVEVAEEDAPIFSKVSLGRFLNDIPHLDRQKTRYKVSILVLQFLFFLLRRNEDAYEDRTEALKSYGFRHLINEVSPRTHHFLKILIAIPEAGFALPRLLPRIRQPLKALAAAPRDTQPHELEIIPYESLWEIIQELTQVGSK